MNGRVGAPLWLLIAVTVTTACAGGRFVRPSGTPVPFPDAASAWGALSEPCRQVTSGRFELRVSGRLGGDRVPSLLTGLAVDGGRLALEARAGATRVFSLAGDAAELTLLNHREGRVTRGPTADLMEALIGVRLSPDRLLALLSGCVSSTPDVLAADRVGTIGRLRTADSLIYLSHRSGAWRLLAAEFDTAVADYRRVEEGWPREIEVRREPDVTLTFRVIEFQRNPQLPPAVFRVPVPASFVELPLDALRDESPLGRSAPQRDR